MYLFKIYNVNKKFKLDNKSNYYALRNINLVFPSKGLHFIKGKSGSWFAGSFLVYCGDSRNFHAKYGSLQKY